MRKERREAKTTYSSWGIWMDGKAGQVRAVWPSYRSNPARIKALHTGVPAGGPPQPSQGAAPTQGHLAGVVRRAYGQDRKTSWRDKALGVLLARRTRLSH